MNAEATYRWMFVTEVLKKESKAIDTSSVLQLFIGKKLKVLDFDEHV